MEKKKTPVSTVIFYIIGIILLIVSLFMLWTAVNYTKDYLASYDASFKDMWTNTVQYVITQFVPYLGMGVICLGLGRAIYGTANAKAGEPAAAEAAAEVPAAESADEAKAGEPAETAKAADGAAAAISPNQIDELIRRIDTNREVLSIKIEEKEKRDSFRIKELEKKVEGFLSDVKYINEPLEELVYKQAAGVEDEEVVPVAETEVKEPETAEAPAAPAVTPQVFRVARNMTMPVCPAAEAPAAEAPAAEAAPAGPTPQIFRVSRNMTMPVCPAAEAAPATEAAEAGLIPQIFTVSRKMTMPKC